MIQVFLFKVIEKIIDKDRIFQVGTKILRGTDAEQGNLFNKDVID